MTVPARTDYDQVVYPSAIYPQTHPDRLATVGTIFGMKPPAVDHCRVLELGCGDGANVTAMAFGLPGSEFQGVDLAAGAIGRGRRTLESLGLKNVTLRPMDLLETPAGLGRFDYIVAHGLYSWVPAPVRDKILALCRDCLSEHGIAYLSYNAYPGNHLRDLARRMMRFHVRDIAAPEEQIRQARALMKFLAGARPNPGLWQNLLQQQAERIVNYTEAGFFHDDLSPVNQPFYFHEFIEDARRHQLQYLAEADLSDTQAEGFTGEVMNTLAAMESRDVVVREQYLDFLKGRSFRQTLLCRGELPLDRDLKPERVFDLLVAADVQPARADLEVRSEARDDFHGPNKAVIATGNPIAKAALVHLGKVWPRPVPFRELLARAGERLGHSADNAAPAAQALGEFLVRSYAIGFVELRTHAPAFVTNVSERPAASALARLQIQQGSVVSTLRHLTLKLDDALSRELLRRLDGTRDRSALLRELGELVRSGAAPLRREGQAVTDADDALKLLNDQLDANLNHLARLGVLVA